MKKAIVLGLAVVATALFVSCGKKDTAAPASTTDSTAIVADSVKGDSTKTDSVKVDSTKTDSTKVDTAKAK
jgi:basic membrane lipoprotein Med (substrate-binding protein (PBP1-ABC) superfamily)